jgi:hypothetical protein
VYSDMSAEVEVVHKKVGRVVIALVGRQTELR